MARSAQNFSVAGLATPPKASRRRHIECTQSESRSFLLSSVISLRERNKKRQGKARTSTKGERGRGSKGKDQQKARKLTHRRCVATSRDGAKHGVTQSNPDRERKADRVFEAQHEVRRRAKQSTTSSKHSTTPKQSTKSEAKHGVRGKARRLSCLLQAREKLFPYFVPPLGGAVGGGGRRRWAYNACASPETAAACGRDCPY